MSSSISKLLVDCALAQIKPEVILTQIRLDPKYSAHTKSTLTETEIVKITAEIWKEFDQEYDILDNQARLTPKEIRIKLREELYERFKSLDKSYN